MATLKRYNASTGQWEYIQLTGQDISELINDMASLENVIGSLDNLTTKDKTSLVRAINEVDSKEVDLSPVNDRIEEVNDLAESAFTSASNGKELVGNAITGIDSNISLPTDPTFQQLADAIGNISTGKKWASGTVTNTHSSTSFTRFDGSSHNSRYLNVVGLGFAPKTVIIYRANGYPETFVSIDNGIVRYNNGDNLFIRNGDVYRLTSNAYLRSSGSFRLPVAITTDYTWFAFE